MIDRYGVPFPACAGEVGHARDHLADGWLTQPGGHRSRLICEALARETIAEYREKLGWHWGFEDLRVGQYAVKCGECHEDIRRTDSLAESAAGGLCDDCRAEASYAVSTASYTGNVCARCHCPTSDHADGCPHAP